MYKYVLFDLDGTVSDPMIGICTSVQYSLTKMGLKAPDINTLTPFIGPPLKTSYKEFYNFSEEEAEQAVLFYRERYSDIGLFENELYPGMADMLRDLTKKGCRLAIASGKPTVFVKRILEKFQVAQYFEVMMGSEFDGTREKKIDAIMDVLKIMCPGEPVSPENFAMVGDRKFDIIAGKEAGFTTIAVSYGYGPMEELTQENPDIIVDSVEALHKALS